MRSLIVVVALVLAVSLIDAKRASTNFFQSNSKNKNNAYDHSKLNSATPDQLRQRRELRHDATQFKNFLLKNVLPSSMPRSFAIQPTDYFEKVPSSERPHHYTTNHYIVPCHNDSVPPQNMNNYMFQTEQLLTALGLNIYDGAMWCIALSILGEYDTCIKYYENTVVPHKTVQFPDIRGDAPCHGVMEYGECTDPDQNGRCGFCYGNGAGNGGKTLTVENAYFFRLISDYWAIEGTVDARCPQYNMEWTWNDYKPILGENSWAQLLGPASIAMQKYKNDPTQIPASDPVFALGIPFLQALAKMKVGDTGAFYYTPFNTWFGFNKVAENIGATFSTENQASLLAGLEALNYLITKNPSSPFASYTTQIQSYISGLKKYFVTAFDKTHGYFRQGGTYDYKTGTITWGQNNEPQFAVDCQTWVSSVLGTKFIDTNFGTGTAYKLWQITKLKANWTCPGGGLCGVGYTDNTISGQVFSGEWTYGAINWLRVMIADSGYDQTDITSLNSDVGAMYFGLESYLYASTPLNNSTESYNSVKYAEKRYWIPFGWYANPLPATSSTAWAVAVASNFNPFNIVGGKYTRSYD